MNLLVALNSFGQTRSITVEGNHWSIPITPITEAGKDYVGTYESANDQMLISVSITGLIALLIQADVSVHYETNTLWNNNLTIKIKRTGNGIDGGICLLCSIADGENYQPVTTNSSYFFKITKGIGIGLGSATNTRNYIPVQLEISGISVTVPVDNYSATIVFTIASP